MNKYTQYPDDSPVVQEHEADMEDQVALWSDGSWCEAEDLESYLRFMSDDYEWVNYSSVGED